jgi:Mor family transcriptional regulator
MQRDLLTHLTIDEMPSNELKDIALLVGVENAFKILHKFRGRSIYFPTYWQRNVVQKWVSAKYNGANVKDLAKELEVSETTIRQAAAKKRVKGPFDETAKPKSTIKQIDLFEKKGLT